MTHDTLRIIGWIILAFLVIDGVVFLALVVPWCRGIRRGWHWALRLDPIILWGLGALLGVHVVGAVLACVCGVWS